MLEIKIKSISHWTGKKTKEPRRSQFRQTYRDTMKILEKELSHLDILWSSLELEMFVHPNQIRQDGQLRAGARPYEQGIKLNFYLIQQRYFDENTQKHMVRGKTLTYPCDCFDNWQDNLRAIALSLEALRKVERYGVFTFTDVVSRLALPSAEGKTTTKQEAAEFIARYSDYPPHALDDKDILTKAYRQAAAKLHPDKGGSTEDFQKLQDAYEVLK